MNVNVNDIMRHMKERDFNIFHYTSYRAFLGDYGDKRKAKNPRWSYGAWARRLDLSGTASLTMIINGQRNPGKEITQKLLNYFEFSKKESDYFIDLIRLEKVKDDTRLSVLLMEKLNRQSPYSKFVKVNNSQLRVISKWYYYAIREMVHLKEFREDSKWIAEKLLFEVSPRDVKKAIDEMIELELLKRDADGKVVYSVGSIDTESDVANEYLKRFHEEMISHGRSSIRKVPVQNRSINGMTLTINQKDVPKAKELIAKFQDQLCKLMEAKNGDSTYQLNVQFFPLTKDE
jgi:uncharacterized protein (TIGR02147 family)